MNSKQLATNLASVSVTYFYNNNSCESEIYDDEGNTSYSEQAQEDFNTMYDLFEEMLKAWGTNGI